MNLLLSFLSEMPRNFPSSTSIRLIYLFWSFAGLVIGTSYAGCLYSIMTVPIGNPAIDTIEKLAYEQAKGRIQVTSIKGSSYYQNFKV